jgi:hypothetical protein
MSGMSVTVPGRDSLPEGPNGGPYLNAVSGDYFATLGMRIVEGRPITDRDVAADARVAVLTEPMAHAYWPGESALGRCIHVGSDSACTIVVGVAEPARERITSDKSRFFVYTPASSTWADGGVILVRTRGEVTPAVVRSLQRTAQSVSPDLPYVDVRPMTDLLARQIRPWRLGARLFSAFGVLAAVIAALGLYSAIAYLVTRRQHEFGVRRALGAQVSDVARLVLGQGVRATALGIILGLAAAFEASRFVADLLFETSARNPAVYAAVAAAMLLVAVAATLIPAWRAARVDPVSALRAD